MMMASAKASTIFAASALASIGMGAAHAVVIPTTTVQVYGRSFDVTYFEGSYNSNSARFSVDEMPWFEDSAIATVFSNTVATSLGSPYNGAGGPYFACRVTDSVSASYYNNSFFQATNLTNALTVSYPYAVVAPSPVPAPLPVVGAAAVFGFARRLRTLSQRVNQYPG